MFKFIKSAFFDIIVNLLSNRKFTVISPEQLEAQQKLYSFVNIVEENDKIISIVFSKDRAIQLHAFLESYFCKIENASLVVVLYKASSIGHIESYEEIKLLYKNNEVQFVEETSFKKQLIKIVEESHAKRVVFYVDDMIFTHVFDYSKLYMIDTYKNIISFTRGKDLTFSTVLDKELSLPSFKYENDFLSFDWKEVKEFSDWTYPLGVSGYMYGRDEILQMLKIISFKAPNSLESEMQKFIYLFEKRRGLCAENTIAVCVHDNLTQTEITNKTLGNFTIEELLQFWSVGKRIDVNKFYNKPATVSQKLVYEFIDRT